MKCEVADGTSPEGGRGPAQFGGGSDERENLFSSERDGRRTQRMDLRGEGRKRIQVKSGEQEGQERGDDERERERASNVMGHKRQTDEHRSENSGFKPAGVLAELVSVEQICL